MDQLDPVGVYDGEERWVGQKVKRLLSLVTQQPRKPAALGQIGKVGPIILVHPAVKGTKAPTFQAKEQADGDNLTRVQMGIGALVDSAQLVVSHAKQADDDFVRGHTVLL
jgi:hypothetical protein